MRGPSLHRRLPLSPHQLRHHRRREKGRSWQWQRDAAGFILWCHTAALPQKKKVGLLHRATRLCHVNVGSQPAVGFTVWAEYFSIHVSVHLCVCVCVVCVHVGVASVMQNARGTPNHPVFHPVLLLPYSFQPFLSSVSLSPLLSF